MLLKDHLKTENIKSEIDFVTPSEPKKILVKKYTTEEEHKQVRHAAAGCGLSISDFLKNSRLADVEKVMAEFIKQFNRAKRDKK